MFEENYGPKVSTRGRKLLMANNYVLIGGFARHDFVIRKSLIVTIYNDLSGTNDFGAVPKQASFPK